MASLLFPTTQDLPPHAMREVAPGVWIQVRRSPRLTKAPAVLHDVKDRISGVLATITGRSQTVDLDEYIQRVERKAA
jgi:hypothetical protein